LSGWFVPPTTGSYYFIISSDDDSDLFLSTDSDPAHKRMIAQQPGWNATRQWSTDSGGGNDYAQRVSTTFSAPDGSKPFAGGIPLTAGQAYYIEADHHEGGGGDNLGVAALLVGTAAPADADDAAIPSDQIGLLYVVPSNFSATTTPGSTSAFIGTSVSFHANVTTDSDDIKTYQWQVNGVDVAGATGPDYTTKILAASDTGMKVGVKVGLTHFPNTATSPDATITVAATGQQAVTGYLKWEHWAGANRTAVESGNVGAPTWVRNLTSFETPSDYADNYADRVSGYFTPATSGNYTFEVSSDDDSDLFLSTDASPANKRLIAQQTGWNANREWAGEAGTAGAPGPQRVSDTWVPDPANPPATTPFAGGIPLVAGTKYYIEGVHGEGGGGDNFAVTAWLTTTGTPPVDGDPSALTGNLIGYATAPATTLTITQQPKDATITSGFGTNFTVSVSTDSQVQPTYQWLRNGVAIPGATSATYGVTPTAADNQAVYSVVVSVPGTTLTATSTGAKLTVLSPVFTKGFVKWEYFPGSDRPTVEANNPAAAVTSSLPSAEGPVNYSDNYASRISGYFTPATTDDYVFFVSSDDDSDLFLSTDDNPANKKLIAQEANGGWSNSRQWNTASGSATPADKRSDTFGATQWPDGAGGVSNTIHLTAGTRYYLEAVQHDGGGGDDLGITVVTQADADAGKPADGDPSTLTGDLIGFFVPPATVTFVTQPANVAVTENRTATFTASATTDSMFGANSVSYQWQRNGVNITGANAASYTTPLLSTSNSGDKYTVVVGAPGATPVTSSIATLTVNPDTVPPAVVSAGAVKRGPNGTIEIGVGFDEAIDGATAVGGNFTLSKGSVTKVRFEPYDTPIDVASPSVVKAAVVLETSGLAAGDTVNVTVKNVKDLKGNPIPVAGVTMSVTVSSKMTWVDTGGNDYQDGVLPANWDATVNNAANYYDDAVALNTDKDFDLISGGSQNWDNYEETTFVYESITGDFDRIARVEYQDPSSQWARAGIMARKATDQGITRSQVGTPAGTADPGYPFSADMIIRVNPVVQWNGAAGNNSYEFVWRENDGGTYASTGPVVPPPYPNAWLRLQRSGQLFTGFTSSDGKTWTTLATHDWTGNTDPVTGDPAEMPATLLVGPYFGPELNNNDAFKIGHSVVAKFRDYGPFGTVIVTPNISAITLAGNNLTITWVGAGTLEWTSDLGPGATWTSTNDSDGSYSESVTTAQKKFFRVKQ